VKVLDLFAGLRGWSDPWAERGHETFSIDYDTRFDVSAHLDIGDVPAVLASLPWKPDVVLASPPCEAFSVMTIGRNWTLDHQPKTDKARLAIELVRATRQVIEATQPTYFVIENPRAKLRKLPLLVGFERRTVTYCQLGEPYMKPTDLWGGFPPSLVLPDICRPRADCHVSAARGSRTGVQGPGRTKFRGGMIEDMARLMSWSDERKALSAERAKIPRLLSLAVCEAAERDDLAAPAPMTLWAAA
jgi:hypothetical protein